MRAWRAWQTGTAKSRQDRKSTRLNSSHSQISYAVFCLKKKKNRNVVYHYLLYHTAAYTAIFFYFVQFLACGFMLHPSFLLNELTFSTAPLLTQYASIST